MGQKQRIVIKGEDKTDEVAAWMADGAKTAVTFKSGKTYRYNAENVSIIMSAVDSLPKAKDCFDYLLRIAAAVGLKTDDGKNILANRYTKIDFVESGSLLAAFLGGKLPPARRGALQTAFFPFGFNISQKTAVDKALAYPLSIIEGPPGTGKTQTILNIVANAVMRGESVAVVSGNNSATGNVLEKLEKHGVGFIAAYLGNSENKAEFIRSQKSLPDLSAWKLQPGRLSQIRQFLGETSAALMETLNKKNALSALKGELERVQTEYGYFAEYCQNLHVPERMPFNNGVAADIFLALCAMSENYAESGKRPGFFGRMVNGFLYGLRDKEFFATPPEIMMAFCQRRYYEVRIADLTKKTDSLQREIAAFDFDGKMKRYAELSLEALRGELARRYSSSERQRFGDEDLWKRSEDVIRSYPVILSTAYSLRSSLSSRVIYDYVIIDESSQVDIATGALALSCAKRAVIVGDLKQLPNVVDNAAAKLTDAIFDEFDLPEAYRYKNHSLLSTIIELFPDAPRTLLREHYRCHPKIIEFCNRKFYNDALIILTEPKSERQPIVVYQTVEGAHERAHINQRQIDVIKQEVIPRQRLDIYGGSVGVVTPYRNQTNALQAAFAGTSVKADTVDKFQGRENNVIILSTVDDEVSDFADNANRLNVAVSRAIEQLIVVISAADMTRDTNIGDLVRYIRYNNMEVIRSVNCTL